MTVAGESLEVPASASKAAVWAGRIMSGLVIVFLLFDAGIKLLELDVVKQSFEQLGYPAGLSFGLGVLVLVCTLLYAVPQTSVLGAILLTGLMGGAMATHLRAGSPVFSHLLFGGYLGLMVWGGLFLRDPKLRALDPVSALNNSRHHDGAADFTRRSCERRANNGPVRQSRTGFHHDGSPPNVTARRARARHHPRIRRAARAGVESLDRPSARDRVVGTA